MKNLVKLSLASILGLVALSSAALADHHEGKHHGKKHHGEKAAHEKTEKVEEKTAQ